MKTNLSREWVAQVMRDKITFSGQTGDYVIHGAIDEIVSEHYKAINNCDDEFNKLVRVCNILAKAACKHDLHIINEWVQMYTNDDTKLTGEKYFNPNES